MTRRLPLAQLCCLSLALYMASPSRAAEPSYKLSVVTDRPEALYAVGQQVEFKVTLQEGGKSVHKGKVSYVLDNDGMGPAIRKGVLPSDGPLVIGGSLDKPGFLRCQVVWQGVDKKPRTALAAAGIEPEKIPPSLPVPDDFDAFWAAQKAKLAGVPAKATLTPVKATVPGIECFDAQVACVGKPVSGYFARPVGAKPKSLPAMLYVHGAGVRSSNLWAAANAAKQGMLGMDVNAHGIPNGKPKEFYDALSKGELKEYRHSGREDREKCYFLGMFLRLMRAMDFLCSQPEWDGAVLVVQGGSQGGGQSLAAAGLDSRVTMIAAGVPALCDHTGCAAGRINGWPKLVTNGPDGKPAPKVLQAARYFDCMNFATRAKAEAIVSVGFIDGTCPPSSVYAAYNNLPGKKSMVIEPLMGHSSSPKIGAAFQKAIADHVRAKKAAK